MNKRISKWYLAQGQNDLGNYISIKEEDTDLIVSYFGELSKEQSNRMVGELTFMVETHNAVVKELRKATK